MSGASGTYAHTKANMYLYNSLVAQSRLMAYVDVFAIFALAAFLLIPLAFYLNVDTDPGGVNDAKGIMGNKWSHQLQLNGLCKSK